MLSWMYIVYVYSFIHSFFYCNAKRMCVLCTYIINLYIDFYHHCCLLFLNFWFSLHHSFLKLSSIAICCCCGCCFLAVVFAYCTMFKRSSSINKILELRNKIKVIVGWKLFFHNVVELVQKLNKCNFQTKICLENILRESFEEFKHHFFADESWKIANTIHVCAYHLVIVNVIVVVR